MTRMVASGGKTNMAQSLIRFITCLAGLSGIGVIVGETLKKWQIIGKDLSLAWVVMPILMLFVLREVAVNFFIKDNERISPELATRLTFIVNVVFFIGSIAVFVSIPCLWFGVIEELAGKGG